MVWRAGDGAGREGERVASWGKEQERPVVRAIDALCGVLSGAPVEPARQVVASRALLVIERHLFPMHEELVAVENADAAAREATSEMWADDAAVRSWLTEVLRDQASAYNDHHDVYEGDWGYVDASGHPLWSLLDLSPLSRRLRLLQDATAKTGAGLGRDVGVGAHQLGHWAAGRSRPGEAERQALARALGIHPGWLAAARDEQPDIELYRFRACPCENAGTMTRGGLGREEADWYESAAEQDAAVHWCDACGQPWARDSAAWLLPLPPGEEGIPHNGALADGSHPAIYVHHRSFDEAWPPVLWRPPHNPLKRVRARTGYLPSAVLSRAPQALTEQLAPVSRPTRPVGYVRPEDRPAANASWCRSCRDLVGAAKTQPGGPWVLLHRSERRRSLSTWSYPSEADAHHAAAHLVMAWLAEGGEKDTIIDDLFAGQAHAQVLARFMELNPGTDLFEVCELVPMRADQI